jgi:hypothetical protein
MLQERSRELGDDGTCLLSCQSSKFLQDQKNNRRG